jgi:hypothetical protein
MDKLNWYETIIVEWKEQQKSKFAYLKQYHQYAKRLWFVPYLLKLALLTLFALSFYFLGYSDAPVLLNCDELRPFIINLPATGAQ